MILCYFFVKILHRGSSDRRQTLPPNFKPLDISGGEGKVSADDNNNIKVVCRFRPPNEKEDALSTESAIVIDIDANGVKTNDGQEYFFDYVFDRTSKQQVFKITFYCWKYQFYFFTQLRVFLFNYEISFSIQI